ncbi:beta-ketoacyl-ACP synthase III [Aquimarina addita]|uniref:Beta-ketoacyl-ACP synthase III n=1 Tax=Aquimarina addita TaxID=870485 RepID=A0ABP6UPQ1_9FLAO
MITSKPIKIVSTGKYLPAIVSSIELEKKHGIPLGWSSEHSGVTTRHIATTESNGYMGARAAEQSLDHAKMILADIDMIISASGTFDYPIPNQASIIKSEMKDGYTCHIPAIDINSTCLSFITAFEYAANILNGKQYKNVLIISSEIASKGLNPDNWETLTLFGDGAAAVIVSYDETSESTYFKGGQQTYSEGVYHTIIEGGGNQNPIKEHAYHQELHSFKMNGKHLLKMAIQKIPVFIDWFFKDLDINIYSVDVIVPHQASKLGLSIFNKLYDIEDKKVKKTLASYGNCIAASIPLTLINAIESGEISRGDQCLLVGTSAGFSIGGVLLKY